ncbi:MAG: acetylornithine deacetylase [Mucilaginibacter sp.]|nr:acetylornithine deacetylase [Mucilaginibacter sp.]
MTNQIKTTIRSLLKNKAYGLLNISGLAIGIACAGLIFLWVADELTFDNSNIKMDRLYSVQVNSSYGGNSFTMGSTPRLMAASLKAEIPGVANACRLSDEDVNSLVNIGGNAMYASGRYTDPSLFSMFTLAFIQGKASDPFPQLHSIVITEKTAKKFFGNDPNVIGKTVRINNEQDYVVTGVVKDVPQNSTLQFEWLAPYEAQIQQQIAKYGHADNAWNSYGPLTYVELAPSASLTAVNKKLYNYIHHKDATQKSAAFLFPMNDWHLYNEFANGKETGGGAIKQVRMLSLIAWIVLFIACINFMNLATARSEKRAKEIGVRKVLGSGRKKLILQFIVEALLMSAMATILAIVIMIIALPAFNTLVQKTLTLGLNDPVHIVALLVIATICGLLAGSYPALYLSSFDPIKALKGLKIKTGSATMIRKGLVVLQFTVSVVFIISTIIIYLQIQHVKDRNMGFNKDNLVEIDMQHGFAKNFLIIKQDLLNTGLVQNAALSDHTTIYGGNLDDRFTWDGKSPDNRVAITFRDVSAEFVSTSGMHIAEGRDFTEALSDTSNAIVTQSFAKIIDKNGVVGKIIRSPREQKEGSYKNLRIIGVVDDYVYGNMYGQSGPAIFLCRPPFKDIEGNANLLYVRIKNGHNSQQTLAEISAVIKKNNPAFPFQYKFVDDQFNTMFSGEVLMSKLSSVFAVLAIIISCLGLFSLAAYTAERRIKEIGIRKVLGASVPGLAGLLSKEFLQLVGISCLLAFPVAWWMMNNWLQSYQYRVAIHWWIFALAGCTALLVALITVSFQAIKAALINPVKSLRSE